MVFESQQAAHFDVSTLSGWNHVPTRQICSERLRCEVFHPADKFPERRAEQAIITEYDSMAHGLSIQNHRGLHG
jgi:hypothetical protein